MNLSAFNQITAIWGVPDIDLYASRINAKVKVFCAWKPDPEAQSIDAFTSCWKSPFVYAFPPFCLLGKVLKKVASEQVTGIVVFPYWPT